MLRLFCVVSVSMLLFQCSAIRENSLATSTDTDGSSLSVLLRPGFLLKKGDLAKIALTGKPVVPLDSVLIAVSAADMPAETWRFNGDAMTVKLQGLAPGSNRLIEARLIDTSGRVAYQGMTPGVDIISGGGNHITMECKPSFSKLTVLFPLGMASSSGISSGSLTLIHEPDTFSTTLQITGETGEFFFPNIKGGLKYGVHVELRLPDGRVKYREIAYDSVQIPVGAFVQYKVALAPQLGGSNLTLKISPVPEVEITFLPLDATKRPPTAGEVVITEFYPEPPEDKGATEGEWLEIYNRTLDTLTMDSCRIVKTRASKGASTRHFIPEGTSIIPGQAVVFGRDSVPFKDFSYAFRLSNTKQSILLLCENKTGDVLVDSVSYTAEYTPIDSIPSKSGLISSLDYARLGAPPVAANWCLTEIQPGGVGVASSPGRSKLNCP